MRWRSIVVLAVVCAGVSGCATLVNPGKSRSVESRAGDGNVKVARLRLKNTGAVLAVYEGNRELPIRDEASHDLHVSMCRTYNENGTEPPNMVRVSPDCMGWILFPYVELQKGVPHTLRLVRGGQEASVTVKTGTHWQWFWLNGVCLALVPACWAVDIASGSWSYFGSLDVAHTMQSAARSASVSHD